MQLKNLPYTLGLDIGMASVGAALLLPDAQRIIAMHVRTFDRAEVAKTGESLNSIRRESRLTRRRLRRHAHRLVRLARLMRRRGIIDSIVPKEFIDPLVSPWTLRAEGLERKLEPGEWATALYHLVKHRGFQSNRKSEARIDEKAGQMLAGVGHIQSLLKAQNYRTVGELIAHDQYFKEAKRNKGGSYSHTVARSDIEAELNTLFECQRELGQRYADANFQNEVRTLLLARRPTLSGEKLLQMVGRCTFEKDEFRSPKASYRAERFVWLGKLNNLKIINGGDARPLTDDERRKIIELPFILSKLTFQQVRNVLDLKRTQRFNMVSYRVNPDAAEKNHEDSVFFEAKYFKELCGAYRKAGLDKEWQRDSINPDRLDTLAYALTCYKNDAESRDWMMEQGIEPGIIEAVLVESFDQFIHLSQKALKKIIPFMEQGQRYDEAAAAAGYHPSQLNRDAIKTKWLPPPDSGLIRNPVVYRALNQARKLVNAVVRQYGPPAAVHIELARDLSKSYDERKKIEREQKEFQMEKEKSVSDFEERFGFRPKALDREKWRLFREQLDQCPYCQKALDINQLFSVGYAQVDHVLPYSRSLDDGMNNKVVVHIACNQNKGNRTPYEFLDGENDSERWRYFKAWVEGNKALRQGKRNSLLRIHFGAEQAEEFRARHLNDTRYICREFKRLVETYLEWHPDVKGSERCVVVSGRLTSLLRARWGLIKIRKNGDLHHAMDAAVIAATGRNLIKRMANYARRRELESVTERYTDPETGEILSKLTTVIPESRFPEPWPHFRKELQAWLTPDPASQLIDVPGYDDALREAIRPVRVSRAPTRRGLGAAHQDTIRSIREGFVSAIKTPLKELGMKDLENIVGYGRDTGLINTIRARLEAFGGDGKKAFDEKQPPLCKPSANPENAPIIRSVKLITTQKSGVLVRGGIANNGAMLRVDIFSKDSRFYSVPLYVSDIVKKEMPNRAYTSGKNENDWVVMDDGYQFLFSLYPNDWVTVRLKDEVREGYYAGFDRATGTINIWLHDRNQLQAKQGLLRSNGIKTALSIEKCHVDFLGNLHRVRQEKREPLRVSKGQR